MLSSGSTLVAMSNGAIFVWIILPLLGVMLAVDVWAALNKRNDR